MATGGSSLDAKLQGHEADHTPPSNAEVKSVGAVRPILHRS
jgi:hypothetical protein